MKYLFIAVNWLFALIISLYSGDNGVSITHNLPATVAVGQKIPVEIKINKGELNGFAKLQIELPEGVTISENEESGATFTIEEGIAKWVWATVPIENEIVVRFMLSATEVAVGVKSIAARYSYVEDNVKQVAEMPTAEINFVGPGAASTPMPSVNSLATETLQQSPSKDSVLSNLTGNKEPERIVTVVRQINAGAEPDEFIISLKINKGNTGGFARYSDDMPEGINVKPIETDGSSFSEADGKIKFVWVNVPEKEELNISYSMQSKNALTYTLNGEYSYLEQNQSKKFKLQPESINFQGGNTLARNEKSKTKAEAVPEQNTEKNEPLSIKKNLQVNYKVQIGAFKNAKVTVGKLRKKFKVKEPIQSEMQEGFTKFMTGRHDEYGTARNHREKLKENNGIKSAFVVAYNNGKRITVQEALMITNQKWFK
jgi:hypothetical protein